MARIAAAPANARAVSIGSGKIVTFLILGQQNVLEPLFRLGEASLVVDLSKDVGRIRRVSMLFSQLSLKNPNATLA
jgi:hypothetical protein